MTAILNALARRGSARRPVVLAFVDLVQDIEVMLPVLLAIRSDARLDVKVVASRWLERESPRTAALLEAHGFGFSLVRRREVVAGRAPSLRGVAAVLAASESSHPAHAAGHALAIRARSRGIRTYALQHGFENVGLFGIEAGAADFASDVVFCWFPQAAVPEGLPAQTRAKLAHLGRPDPPGGWRSVEKPVFRLGVFENLHWDRYGDADRSAFVEGLLATARALPDARILVRPHPAGGWLDRLGHELAPFANITWVRASDARASMATGAEVVRGMERVVTTPSTVALDAALAGRPVALAAEGGRAYAPLPILRTPQHWVAFATGGIFDPSALDQFRSRVLVAGDGARRIIERLSRDLVCLSSSHE